MHHVLLFPASSAVIKSSTVRQLEHWGLLGWEYLLRSDRQTSQKSVKLTYQLSLVTIIWGFRSCDIVDSRDSRPIDMHLWWRWPRQQLHCHLPFVVLGRRDISGSRVSTAQFGTTGCTSADYYVNLTPVRPVTPLLAVHAIGSHHVANPLIDSTLAPWTSEFYKVGWNEFTSSDG